MLWNLPFEDNTYDYVTIGFGLRNVPDYLATLKVKSRIETRRYDCMFRNINQHYPYLNKFINFTLNLDAYFREVVC